MNGSLKLAKKLLIGTAGDYPPFTFLSSGTNRFEGFDIELITRIAEISDISIDFVKTNWYDLHNDLKNEKFTMAVGGISLTDERKESFLTSIPIMEDGKTILMNKAHAHKIKSLKDADNDKYTIIVNRGGTNEQFVNEQIKHAKVIMLDDNIAIFAKLAAGEADVMITDLSEALYRQSVDERLTTITPITIYTKPLSYGYIYNNNIANLSLKNAINKSLEEFMKLDEFKELYNKYFNSCKNT